MAHVGRFAAFRGLYGKFHRDSAGAMAIMVALMLPIIVAASGLVIDAGYYRYRVRVLQSASDSAALAAARDGVAGLNTGVQMWSAADTEAVRNGFMDGNFGWNPPGTTSTAKGSLVVNSPPSVSAAYHGQLGYVEVVLTENRPRIFAQVWMGNSLQSLVTHSVVKATSTGSGSSSSSNTGSGCIMALDPASSQTFRMQNQGSAVNANCEVVVNSSNGGAVFLNGPAQQHIVMNSLLSYVGGINYNNGQGYVDFGPPPSGYSSNPNKIAKAAVDPYAASVVPATIPASAAGPCIDVGGQPLNWNGGTLNLPAGHYCKGFAINGGTVNLSPGITYVDQQFQIQNGATVNGLNGSTLVIGNGYTFQMSGGHLNMKAPTSGITAGLAVTEYSDSGTNGSTVFINNNSTMQFTGAIYFPRRLFYLQQTGSLSSFGGTGGCGHIIAWQVDIENGMTIGDSCSGIGVIPFGTGAAPWASSYVAPGAPPTSGTTTVVIVE